MSHRGCHRSHLNSVSGESRGARGATFAEISSLDTVRNLRVTGEGSMKVSSAGGSGRQDVSEPDLSRAFEVPVWDGSRRGSPTSPTKSCASAARHGGALSARDTLRATSR